MSEFEDYIKAGKIASQAREYGKKLFKPGAKIVDIAEAIEQKMRDLGAEPGFPVCISLNDMAAHYSPFINDIIELKEGDLVKLDMGSHINGFVADTACTIEIKTSKFKNLIKASEDALAAAIKVVKPGVALAEVGKAIQATIEKAGFHSITNLCGHGLNQYIVHDWPTVPNYDNKDPTKLKEGQAIAIEPFSTTGLGLVSDGKPCGIYVLINKKPTRLQSARQVIQFIEKNYNTLPFSCRWIKVPNAQFILRTLENEGILKQYTQLPEKSKGMVAQTEHSIIVGKKVITE